MKLWSKPSRWIWQLWCLGTALLVLAPIVVVLSSWLIPLDQEIWTHFAQGLFLEYVTQSLGLALFSVVGAAILGTLLAWWTTMYELPARRLLVIALLLPMAIPSYVLAFIFTGLAEDWFRFRGLFAAAFTMTIALYPYVFYLMRSAFLGLDREVLEAGKLAGMNDVQLFFRLALPQSRTHLFAGCALIVMEVMADFGTVSNLGVETLTVAIYKTWYGFHSLTSAAQVASFLVVLCFIFLAAEVKFLKDSVGGVRKSLPRKLFLSIDPRLMRILWLGLWLFFGFVFLLPMGQLVYWCTRLDSFAWMSFIDVVGNSVLMAGVASLVVVFLALVLSEARRRSSELVTRVSLVVARLGYALPGAVLAIGLYVPIVALDHYLANLTNSRGGWLSGSILVVIGGYTIRFLSVGLSSIKPELGSIAPSLDEAAASFGAKGFTIFRHIHLPLLTQAVLTGLILTFVDCLKEMPLTLMTRPFGRDTLAVKVYQFTNEGEWQLASLPAIILVLTGFLSVLCLSLPQKRRRNPKTPSC